MFKHFPVVATLCGAALASACSGEAPVDETPLQALCERTEAARDAVDHAIIVSPDDALAEAADRLIVELEAGCDSG